MSEEKIIDNVGKIKPPEDLGMPGANFGEPACRSCRTLQAQLAEAKAEIDRKDEIIFAYESVRSPVIDTTIADLRAELEKYQTAISVHCICGGAEAFLTRQRLQKESKGETDAVSNTDFKKEDCKYYKDGDCGYTHTVELLEAEVKKLNIILFHRENGLSHPDLQGEIGKSKMAEELENIKKELRDEI
jgi:hypothetical protein